MARTAGDFGDRVRPGLGLGGQEAEEQEAVGRQAGDAQGGDRGARSGNGANLVSRGAGVADELVAGVGNQRRAGVADQCDRFAAEARDDRRPVRVGAVIVVPAHRHFRADVREQLAGDAGVLGEDSLGAPKHIRGSRRKVAEIPDRSGDDIKSGSRLVAHPRCNKPFQRQQKRIIMVSSIVCALGEGAMIALVGASAIYLIALQASIAAPTQTFRTCLKDASGKATSQKIAPDAYEAFIRNACTTQLGALRSAVISFRMKNGMARKAAADDADMTVDDYVGTSVDNYKFMADFNAPPKSAGGCGAAGGAATSLHRHRRPRLSSRSN